MQGKAHVLGHPLHVVTIAFPVAFWTGAAITDALGWWSHDPFWPRMSVVLILFGNIAGFIACVPGFVDYFTIRLGRKTRMVAIWHAVASTITLGFFVFAYKLRAANGDAGPGMWCTWAGDAALLVGAFFGSDLVATYGLGVRESRQSPLRQ